MRSPEADREYQRQRTAAVRGALITMKLESGCVDCGYNDNPDALQFDHVRGEKLRNVAAIVGHNVLRAIEEAEKCDVRCANCHSIRTAERRRTKE